MATSILRVAVVSAEAEVYAGDALRVIAPATEGELGITPGHTPLLTRLRPGEVKIRLEAEDDHLIYVSGGLLEIQPFVVTVLADTARRAEDLDEAAAREAARRARYEIDHPGIDRLDPARARARLAEAEAQLRTLEDLHQLWRQKQRATAERGP